MSFACSGLLVSPHAADDAVGEVAFVGSSGFSSGLSLGGFLFEVEAGSGLVAGFVHLERASSRVPVFDGSGRGRLNDGKTPTILQPVQ